MQYEIKTVVLHVTTVCDHNCPFCYYTNSEMVRQHQSFSVLKQIIFNCSKAGANEIIFVGGDPATHPDIVELGKYAHEFGMQTTILSNTLDFQGRSVQEVINAFDAIETTIHSQEAKKHDSFCGCEGAFDNVITNIASFASDKTHLGIVFNLTPNTQSYLFDTVKTLIEKRHVPLDHIVLQRIAQVGRADNNESWNLLKNDLCNIFKQAEEIVDLYDLDINFEDTFPYCIVPVKYRDKYLKPCSWGYDSCAIDLYGNISLCCTDPDYTIGNVLETPLLEIWNDSKRLQEKRAGLCVPESCRQCKDYDKCRGGCILSSITNDYCGDVLIKSHFDANSGKRFNPS